MTDQKVNRTAGKVSVVIPCYNAEQWVARTIASVQAQGDVVDRIIVVDDGSTDDSLTVLRTLEVAGEITLLTGPNGGGSRARNLGLAEVCSPYVMFLDADDEIDGPILRGSYEAADLHGADIIFSKMEVRHPDGSRTHKGPFGPPDQSEREIFANWFDGDWLNPSAVVWSAPFLRTIGGWNEEIQVGDDGEVVLRALLRDARAARNTQGCGVYHRGHAGSVSLAGGITRGKLEQHVNMIIGFCKDAENKRWGDALDRNYAALYFLARKSFQEGHHDLGRATLKFLHRDANHRLHHGTWKHVMISKITGLERKVRWFGS